MRLERLGDHTMPLTKSLWEVSLYLHGSVTTIETLENDFYVRTSCLLRYDDSLYIERRVLV